jgi:hypothetical protein
VCAGGNPDDGRLKICPPEADMPWRFEGAVPLAATDTRDMLENRK